MDIYQLPKIELPKLKGPVCWKSRAFLAIFLIIFVAFFSGFLGGLFSGGELYSDMRDFLAKYYIYIPAGNQAREKIIEKETVYVPQISQEEAIIKTVKEVSPAVVSIIITKDLPVMEEYYAPLPFEDFFGIPFEFQAPQYRQKGTEKKQVGGGTGFIVSEDGMILTNKHVVLDEKAEYAVLTNDGRKFSANVLARDPVQDIAIIKMKETDNKEKIKFPVAKLGDSENLQIGQTVIAIGNALGAFQNTVSVGVVSGLGRTITASGGGLIETLEGIIQTDAAINRGNSGGPLLNLKGEVIGINTAMSVEGENIGFSIPINRAKRDIEQVKTVGKIIYPFLGVRYVLIDKKTQEENNLSVDYGAWIIKGDKGEPAITPGSSADKAELKEKDIILEFNGEKITGENTLSKIIIKYNPEDKVKLKILRNEQEKIIEVALGERSE